MPQPSMDEAAIEFAPTAGLGIRPSRWAMILGAAFLATIAALWAFEAVQRTASGELIRPIPVDVWTGVVFVTALLLLLGAMRLMTSRRDPFGGGGRSGGRIDALVVAPILLFVAISAAARLGVQLVGFAGLHPAAVPVAFTVVDTSHRQSRGGTDYYLLRLRHDDRDRTFSDEVTRAVYEAAREGDTVAVPVETGRFGLQRAMVATPLAPSDLHHPGATPPHG